MNVLIKQTANSITSKDMVNYTNISTLAATIFTKFIEVQNNLLAISPISWCSFCGQFLVWDTLCYDC